MGRFLIHHRRSDEHHQHAMQTVRRHYRPSEHQVVGFEHRAGRGRWVIGHDYWWRNRDEDMDCHFVSMQTTPLFDTAEEAAAYLEGAR